MPVSWEIFERAASRYEAWYTTPRGQRADQAERALLDRLLASFPTAQSVLEVGCGTGHFTEWLARKGLKVVGLDRSPTMLAELHKQAPELPVILSDAHQLPVRTGAVDVVVFVTTIEFLEEPEVALMEAVRAARQGVVLLVLNRWSLGGLSRRVGSQSRQPLLGQARDYSLVSLRMLVRRTAETRLQAISWASTLFPAGLWQVQARIPLGDVIGMAVVLAALPRMNEPNEEKHTHE
jgi:ubiquinone/menaquinone biosynthesis C-methylase UbiE